MSLKIFVLLQAGLQANNVPQQCRQWHHQPRKYLDKDKAEYVDKDTDKEPILRSSDAPSTQRLRSTCSADAPLTQLLRHSDTPDSVTPQASPLPRPSHADVTPLPSSETATMTLLPLRADAPLSIVSL